MSYTLTLNSSNVVGSGNNTYKFNFIAGGLNAKDCEMAIGSLTIPYSWYNVSASYNNQNFTLTVPIMFGTVNANGLNGAPTKTATTYSNTFVLSGFYTVSDINNSIQLWCYNNGFYLTNASGQIVYYINVSTNITSYTNMIVFTQVPSALPSGWYLPTLASPVPATYFGWGLGLPAVSATPSITFPLTGSIGSLLGFSTGTYPSITTATTSSTSSLTPIGSTVNALLCHCSLVNNNLAIPSDILDLIPINSTFGSNITYQPPFAKFIQIRDGAYSSMSITFTDQNNGNINALDSNIAMTLIVKQK